MSDASDSDEAGEQIRVSLTLAAEVIDRTLEVTSEPIAVPASVGRKGLAAVINHLLDRRVKLDDEAEDASDDEDEDDKDKLPAIPFDFVLKENNRLLRSGVEREARRYGLSLEKPLAILYFPAQEAPELQGETEILPDWVSCLSYVADAKDGAYLCAASYDGSLRIYHPQQEHDEKENVILNPIASRSTAHGGPIKCMTAMMDPINHSLVMASGGMDNMLVVHYYDPKSKKLRKQIKCQLGHAAAVSSVDFFPATRTLASGDWDGTLALWDLKEATESEEAQTSKKAKTESKSKSTKSPTKSLAPKALLPKAHSSQISGISWGNLHKNNLKGSDAHSHKTLITGSWDHSVKVWDMERQECILSLNGSRVVACLDTSHHSDGIVATGHPDCAVRLWDVRQDNSASTVSDKTFRPSHKAWVSGVQWSPNNPYHLASTSHDSTVKVWDIRSALPLHTVRVFPKTEKGLCLAYGQPAEGVSGQASFFLGGTDCTVKHFTTSMASKQ